MTHALKTPLPRSFGAGLLAAIAIVGLTGCASQPDRYYTLAAPVGTAAMATAASTPLFIELAPLALPERLARPQMVVNQPGGASAEVKVLEKHRWTSSFENELRDALAGGIATRLGAIDVSRGGRQPSQPAWRIAVQVKQFDTVENSRVDAAFSWTVRRADAERSAVCWWSGSETVASGGIDALAQGAQRVTASAAQAMARHVAALQADPAAACPQP